VSLAVCPRQRERRLVQDGAQGADEVFVDALLTCPVRRTDSSAYSRGGAQERHSSRRLFPSHRLSKAFQTVGDFACQAQLLMQRQAFREPFFYKLRILSRCQGHFCSF